MARAVPGSSREAEDIPAGYKRTEVGVIREDWQTKRIGEIFEVRAGGDLDPTMSGDVQSEKHKHPIYANSLSRQARRSTSLEAPAGSAACRERCTQASRSKGQEAQLHERRRPT